jgi:hypothetical protein
LCLGVDAADEVIVSTHPTRPSSWDATRVNDHSPYYGCGKYFPEVCQPSLADVSCQSAPFCVALDQARNVIRSSDPAGGAATWHVVFAEIPDTDSGLNSIACPSRFLCAGNDGWGSFVASGRPADGQSAWAATAINTGGTPAWDPAAAGHGVGSVVCPSRRVCVGQAAAGTIVTTNPAASVPTWRPAGPRQVSAAVTCARWLWCFMIDQRGDIYSSEDPAGAASSWSRARPDRALTPKFQPMRQFNCPSRKLCLTVDFAGRILVGRVRDAHQA